jgi:hypothetical protein
MRFTLLLFLSFILVAIADEPLTIKDASMISPEQFDRLFPKAVAWVTETEKAILYTGEGLLPISEDDAKRIGIQRVSEVRILALSTMPVPGDQKLRSVAEQTRLISPLTGGMTFGHGIVVKADHQDRELIAHELVHVLQYERFGGIEGFLKAYLSEILPPQRYGEGPLEEEATNVARRICGG